MKWSREDIEIATDLIKSGKRIEEIAITLNREFRSVQIKLQKLGYKQNKLQYTEEITCQNCNKTFSSRIRNKRKFCSQSCSTQYNNKKYPKRANIDKLKNCIFCDYPLNSNQKRFCSHTCEINYKRKIIFDRIENGDTSLGEKQYKKYLIWKYGNKCMKCGWCEINPTTGLVPIQLEHKDGNSENNNLNNLELLCPNHHSLTSTFGALNKGNGRTMRREKRKQNN